MNAQDIRESARIMKLVRIERRQRMFFNYMNTALIAFFVAYFLTRALLTY